MVKANKVFILAILLIGIYICIQEIRVKKKVYYSTNNEFFIVKTVKNHAFSPTEIFFTKDKEFSSSDVSYLRWEMFGRDGAYAVIFAQTNDSFLIILWGGVFDTGNISDKNTYIIKPPHLVHLNELLTRYPEHVVLYGTDE